VDAGVTLDDAQPDYVVLGDLGEELGYPILTASCGCCWAARS